MNCRVVQAFALSALALASSLPAVPAQAGTSSTLTLSITPPDPQPGQSLTVNGDLSPDCATTGTYTVTLNYTKADGSPGTVVETGALDTPTPPATESGTFETDIVLPEDAVADDEAESPADLVGQVDCAAGNSATRTESLTITAHEGLLSVAPDSLDAGDAVTVSGTQCYGGEFVAFYGPAGEEFTGGSDGASDDTSHTFSTELVIAEDTPSGEYDIAASCPGTSYEPVTVTVVGAAAPTASTSPTSSSTSSPTSTSTSSPTPSATTAPTAPPATPVEGDVNFTG